MTTPEQMRSRFEAYTHDTSLGFGGGGTSGGDTWEQSVEVRLSKLSDKIDSQLKWTLVAFASGFIILGGLIINRTDAVTERVNARADAVSARMDGLNERLTRLEERLPPVKH